MNERMHAAGILARRRIQETVIGPGLYLAMTVGLLLAAVLIVGFVRAIDSSGLNFEASPIYDLIARSLAGAFGVTMVDTLFAEGPYLIALYTAFIPVLLYLAIGSVFRIGLERKIGAMEMIAYGPADGTSSILAAFSKDVVLSVLYLVVLIAFFGLTAALYNLVLGPAFLTAVVAIPFLAFALFAYGVLASTLTDNSASAVGLFLGMVILFTAVLLSSFTVVTGYVRTVSTALAAIVQWVSPLFYWTLAIESGELGNTGGFVGSLLAQLALAAIVLALAHLAIRTRGVRPS